MADLAANPLIQHRRVSLDPGPDRDMVQGQAPLRHDLFQIAVREGIPQVPANAQKDDDVFKMPPAEQCWPSSSHRYTLPNQLKLHLQQSRPDSSPKGPALWSAIDPGFLPSSPAVGARNTVAANLKALSQRRLFYGPDKLLCGHFGIHLTLWLGYRRLLAPVSRSPGCMQSTGSVCLSWASSICSTCSASSIRTRTRASRTQRPPYWRAFTPSL